MTEPGVPFVPLPQEQREQFVTLAHGGPDDPAERWAWRHQLLDNLELHRMLAEAAEHQRMLAGGGGAHVTDRERFAALLDSFGVAWTLTEVPDWRQRAADAKPRPVRQVRLTNGDTKVDGYSGFYSEWTFDDRGAFLETGAWE